MTSQRSLTADLAALAGAIERWAGDLALGEEPSRFVVALERGASKPGAPECGGLEGGARERDRPDGTAR